MLKIKHTKPDGNILEVEGTPEEINAVALALGLGWTLSWPHPSAVAGGGLVDLSPKLYTPIKF